MHQDLDEADSRSYCYIVRPLQIMSHGFFSFPSVKQLNKTFPQFGNGEEIQKILKMTREELFNYPVIASNISEGSDGLQLLIKGEMITDLETQNVKMLLLDYMAGTYGIDYIIHEDDKGNDPSEEFSSKILGKKLTRKLFGVSYLVVNSAHKFDQDIIQHSSKPTLVYHHRSGKYEVISIIDVYKGNPKLNSKGVRGVTRGFLNRCFAEAFRRYGEELRNKVS
jgi:hypothetical protein